MTGPEHYLEAQRLVVNDGVSPPPADGDIAIAQVHATLALAAATAMAAYDQEGMVPDDFNAWDAVCGVQEAATDA